MTPESLNAWSDGAVPIPLVSPAVRPFASRHPALATRGNPVGLYRWRARPRARRGAWRPSRSTLAVLPANAGGPSVAEA